jgi:hypothetical protein
MKFIRFLTAAMLFGAAAVFLGCGEESPERVEDLPAEKQEEIEKLRQGYQNAGRGGPGGQQTPPAEGGTGM